MLVVHLTFSAEDEDDTGDGWVVTYGSDDSTATTVEKYATITAAETAINAAFASDDGVLGYFQQAAEATVLAGESVAVDAELSSLLTAEGL